MRYVVSGRLRAPCPLSPAEYFALAVREWETVLGWLESGIALGYGRLGTPSGGALLLEVASDAEARCLAESSPFARYADVVVTPIAGHPIAREPPGAVPTEAAADRA
jgi:hypothetical protein